MGAPLSNINIMLFLDLSGFIYSNFYPNLVGSGINRKNKRKRAWNKVLCVRYAVFLKCAIDARRFV